MRELVPGAISEIAAGGCSVSVAHGGGGRPVLLIHGFAMSSIAWRHQWRPLCDAGFRPIAPDNPGFGRSTCGPGFEGTAEDHCAVHSGLMDAMGIEGPIDVVGHSMGGAMALFMAWKRPDLVRSVVAIAPAASPSAAAAKLARITREEGFDEVAPAFFTRARLAKILEDAYGRNRPPQDVVDSYLEGLSVARAFRIAGRFFSPGFRLMADRCGEIAARVLVVAGADDRHVPVDQMRRLARSIPGSSVLVLDGAAHCPHEEAWDRFNGALIGFLQ